MNYKQKYLKYKLKYLTAKKLYGGSDSNLNLISKMKIIKIEDLNIYLIDSDKTQEEIKRIRRKKKEKEEEKKRMKEKQALENKLKIRPSEDQLKQECISVR